ncbi:MAG: hypothetical protein QOI59_6196 [Gammaproteobacteria bacterium]|nr:hypothetical protein [Gammaproteobacteria bacterium]
MAAKIESYRPEIDGLRAIAVMSVILSHAGIRGMAGGFLGVDIFFVISGFLISGMILDNLDDKNFSIRNFYERRIRRILPALFLVSGLCLVPGWFLMSANAYKNLAESVVASLLSANNILLTITSGYWEMESSFRPLLHTWSLGVEEQYYLVVPFVMVVAYRYFGRHAAWTIGVISLGSFILCIWAMTTHPVGNFYLLPTRAWELGLGGLAVIYLRRQRVTPSSGKLAALGLVATVACMVLVPQETPTPSPVVLIPVVGTALVLVFCRAGLAYRLLVLPPMRWIGLISYSAYLWHQPLFAFLRVASPREPATWEYVALIPVTLILAWLSWRYVEKPFRNRKAMSYRTVGAILAPAGLVLMALCLLIWGLKGIPSRLPLPPGADEPGAYQMYNERLRSYSTDAFPASAHKKLLVLGNSQGRDFINGMQEAKQFPDYGLVYRDDLDLCNLDQLGPTKMNLVQTATLIVEVYPQEISGPTCDKHVLAERPELKGKVVFVGPRDFGVNLNPSSLIPLDRRAEARVQASQKVLDADAYFRSLTPSDLYVSQLADLTADGHSMPIFDENGVVLSEDRLHVTRAGARYVGKRLATDPIWVEVERTALARAARSGN